MALKEVKIHPKDITQLFHSQTPGARFWRYTRSALKYLISLALLYLVFFIIINFAAFYVRAKYTVEPASFIVNLPTPTPTVVLPNYPPSIEIPKIGVSAPLILDVSSDNILTALKDGVVQYQNTAKPGEIGNSVIFGHSSGYPWDDGKFKTVFALLDKLQSGDIIVVPYGSQRFEYTVTSNRIVKPTELSVLAKTTDPTLTLITCYPVGGSSSRTIITAKLTSGSPTGVQFTDPLANSIPKTR